MFKFILLFNVFAEVDPCFNNNCTDTQVCFVDPKNTDTGYRCEGTFVNIKFYSSFRKLE